MLLNCKSAFYILRTMACRACGCRQQVQHSLRSFSHRAGVLGNGSPKLQYRHKFKEYSTYCDRKQRYLSALSSSLLRKEQQRPLSRFDFLDIEEVEEMINNAEKRRWIRRFIVNPDLANLIVEHIDTDLSENNAIIFECNPGEYALID